MNLNDFYFNEFRPSYLEGVVRYPEELDYIVRKNLDSIRFKDLRDISINDLNAVIKQADENYSLDRAKKVRSFCRRIMKNAYACRYIDFDVTAFEFRKLKRRPSKGLQMFTAEQAEFLTRSDNRILKMFRFECLTGLRREEILGLRWENVDLKNRRIYVCETVVIINNKAQHIADTKTHKFRYVDLNEQSYSLLISLPQFCDFVFGNPRTKSFLAPRSYHEEYNKMWFEKNREYKKLTGESLPALTPHKFRHTFASLLVSNNVDVKTVADILGHNTTETTQIYMHAYDDKKKLAVQGLSL